MLDPRTPVDDLDRLNHELVQIREKIKDLSAPSGTSAYQTVSKLQLLVEDIQRQLDEYISQDSYDKAQIDEKIANPGAISPTSINDSGPLTVAGFITMPGVLSHSNANFRTLTTGDNGEIGVSSSSARYKRNIEDADISDEVFDSIRARRYQVRALVEQLGEDAPYQDGFIAEELVEAGVTSPVYFDAEGRPEGINYDRLTPYLWIVLQRERAARVELERRLDVIEGNVG